MIEYVKRYRTPSLVAKVGWIVERHTRKWKVSEADLQSLRPYLPKTPVKFARGLGGALDKEWNLYIPQGASGG